MAQLTEQQKEIYGMTQDEFDRAVAAQRGHLEGGGSGLGEAARREMERAWGGASAPGGPTWGERQAGMAGPDLPSGYAGGRRDYGTAQGSSIEAALTAQRAKDAALRNNPELNYGNWAKPDYTAAPDTSGMAGPDLPSGYAGGLRNYPGTGAPFGDVEPPAGAQSGYASGGPPTPESGFITPIEGATAQADRSGWNAWDYNKEFFGRLLKGDIKGAFQVRQEGIDRFPGPGSIQREPGDRRERPDEGAPGVPGAPVRPTPPALPEPGPPISVPPGEQPTVPPIYQPQETVQFMDPRFEWVFDPYLGVTVRRLKRVTPPGPTPWV